MPVLPFPSAIRADKTIAAAFSLVALLGAAQLSGVAIHYLGRVGSTKAVTAPQTFAPTASPSGVTRPAAVPSPPDRATSAAVTRPAPAPAPVADGLIREAAALRARGDTTNALARLQEAALLDPKNASVLAEMAMVYESIQLFDRSNETWRRLQEIGISAGPLLELADLKLKLGVPASTSSGPGIAGVSPLDAGTARTDNEGIPDGSTFGITEVTPSLNADPEAETHLVLKVGVKARPNTPIDYTKVKIQVFFYDVMDNDRVVLTDADVSYEWLTPDHNWAKTNPEMLAVTYLRPRKDALSSEAAVSAAAAAVTPPTVGKKPRPSRAATPPAEAPDAMGSRKYLGYIVRVYYKDQLQAVRADPNKLLNLFPPPFTAPAS